MLSGGLKDHRESQHSKHELASRCVSRQIVPIVIRGTIRWRVRTAAVPD